MRIIAGSAKGRRFESIEGMDTRPTLDRVKEAMFGSLQFDLPGARVLDLFSGSGALSLESASRGAEAVVANDINPQCVRVIKNNVFTCGFSNAITVLNLDYTAAIEQMIQESRTFSIAFIDAPYHLECGPDALLKLSESELITHEGFVVFEHSRDRSVDDQVGSLKLLKTKNFGSCAFSIFQRA